MLARHMLRALSIIPSPLILLKTFVRYSSQLKLGHHYLKMPRIMDKWLKKRGEKFYAKESLCEVSLEGLTLEINAGEDGYLAEVICKPGESITVEQPIALYVTDKDTLLDFIESERLSGHDDDIIAAAVKKISDAKQDQLKIDNKLLLKTIKNLVHNGEIIEGSDFAKKIMSLARKQNAELLAVFEASFDGETFDEKFFLDNARDIITEELNEKK